MHHWEVGGEINVGWPDFGMPEVTYEIVEIEKLGSVVRARVTDGNKQGGFLVIQDCPEVVLEQLARTGCWLQWGGMTQPEAKGWTGC